MEELISVIVAVYNAEVYLEKCVVSIVNQTYKKIEIILVNDGSTDESGKICDDWKQKDSRIKVIHKENGGHGSAKNIGIEEATGNYIYFCDSDDYLDSDTIENLYNTAKEKEADIVASGYIHELFYKKIPKYADENYTANSEEILRRMFEFDGISLALCGKLYKKELFNNLRLPEEVVFDEISTLYKLFDRSKLVANINKPGYHYVQRPDSVLHTQLDRPKIDIVGIEENILKFIENKYPNIVYEAEKFFIDTLNRSIILSYRNNFKEQYKEFKNKSKEYMKRTLKNPKIKLKTKLKSIFVTYFEGSRILKK